MGLKDKWRKASKIGKVGLITAAAGGAIVGVPLVIAAGPASIVSALCILGCGTLAAGGFGVAGGIIVTVGGAALSAAVAASISSKLIKDPELVELQQNLKEIEGLAVKIQLMEKKNIEKYKDLRERYNKIAEYISKDLLKKKKVDKDVIGRYVYTSRDLIRDLENAVQES